MASLKYTIILFLTVFLPIVVQSDPQVSRRDLSGVINLISKKYSGNKRPIIVILDSSKVNKNRNQYIAETSDELGTINVPHLLLQQQKAKTLSPIKTKTTKSLLQLKQRDRQLHQLQRLRVDDHSLQREDKDALRSPIIKKLLRISNRLQCDAKDDCEDRCSNKFRGTKVIKCKIQCEIKYDCEEEEKDPCADDDCGVDSCGNEAECLMSTRGERLVAKDNKCKRC